MASGVFVFSFLPDIKRDTGNASISLSSYEVSIDSVSFMVKSLRIHLFSSPLFNITGILSLVLWIRVNKGLALVVMMEKVFRILPFSLFSQVSQIPAKAKATLFV